MFFYFENEVLSNQLENELGLLLKQSTTDLNPIKIELQECCAPECEDIKRCFFPSSSLYQRPKNWAEE